MKSVRYKTNCTFYAADKFILKKMYFFEDKVIGFIFLKEPGGISQGICRQVATVSFK